MQRLYLMLPLVFVVFSFAIQVEARPTTRFDATTQTCRILDEGQTEWDSRAWGEGGRLFKQVCKTCHTRNSESGAPFLWAESKSSKAWNRVFAKKYPECAKDGSWGNMSMDKQLKLNDYLYRFSGDSMDRTDNC